MTNAKVALVTGANKGIGFEIARQLGGAGNTVLVGARDASRGEQAVQTLAADGIDAHFVALDVTDPESVAAAAKQVAEKFGRLDVLVNNAGILVEDFAIPPSGTGLDTFRTTYEVNVYGVVEVTNALLPLLRRSDAGRIVNISSELGSLGRMMDSSSEFFGVNLLAYNSSKSALNAITVAYAKELAETGIKVNGADPGYCSTDLNGHSAPRTTAQGAVEAVRLAMLGGDGPTGGFTGDAGPLPW